MRKRLKRKLGRHLENAVKAAMAARKALKEIMDADSQMRIAVKKHKQRMRQWQ